MILKHIAHEAHLFVFWCFVIWVIFCHISTYWCEHNLNSRSQHGALRQGAANPGVEKEVFSTAETLLNAHSDPPQPSARCMCLKIQFHDTQDYVKCTKGIQKISTTSPLHFRKLNLRHQSECMQGTSTKDQDHPWKCKTATCTTVKMQSAKLHNANAACTCWRPHPLHSKANILPSLPFFTTIRIGHISVAALRICTSITRNFGKHRYLIFFTDFFVMHWALHCGIQIASDRVAVREWGMVRHSCLLLSHLTPPLPTTIYHLLIIIIIVIKIGIVLHTFVYPISSWKLRTWFRGDKRVKRDWQETQVKIMTSDNSDKWQ